MRVEAVIGHPAPDAFKVGRSGVGDVEERERSFASAWVGSGTFGVDEGVVGAADAENGIPETDVAGLGGSHVDLQEDCTREDVAYGDEHVTQLGDAFFARVSEPDDGLRMGSIGKVGAEASDGAEDLAYDAGARRDVDGFPRLIDSLGEEDHFAAGILAKNGVDGWAVVVLI